MRIPFLILIFLTLNPFMVHGIKVRDRFKYVPEYYHFKFGLFCFISQFGNENLVDASSGGMSFATISKFDERVNHTVECVHVKNIWESDSNGKFDGLIGIVQSNVTNANIISIPYGSIPNEPGYFVPSPMPPFAPHIYSRRIKGNSFQLDVLFLFANMPLYSWIYWMIAMIICSILCIIIIHAMENCFPSIPSRNNWNIFKRLYEIWWNYFLILIDIIPSDIQNIVPSSVSNFIPGIISVSVIWTFLILSVYYGIHMVFMSTLSADLTVNEPDKAIHSLKDLLDDATFENFRPTIFTQLNTYNMLKQSRYGTDERRLLDKSIATNSLTTIDLTVGSVVSYSFGVFKEISNYTRAIIEDSSYLDIFINQISCHWMPETITNFVKSHDAIYNVPQAILVSYSTPEQIVKLFKYRSISTTEFGIIKGTLQIKSDSIVSQLGIKKSLKGFQCSDTLQGILYRKLETPEWNPLPVYFFGRFFHILSYIMILAAIILFFEMIYDYSRRSADHVTIKLKGCTKQAQIKIIDLK